MVGTLHGKLNSEESKELFYPYKILDFFDLLATYDLTAMVYEYSRDGYPHYVDIETSQTLIGYTTNPWRVEMYLITPADELIDASFYVQDGKIVMSSYSYVYDVPEKREKSSLVDRLVKLDPLQRKVLEAKAKQTLLKKPFS